MAKVPNGIDTLPKISTGWLGRANVTDDRRNDRRRHRWTHVHVKRTTEKLQFCGPVILYFSRLCLCVRVCVLTRVSHVVTATLQRLNSKTLRPSLMHRLHDELRSKSRSVWRPLGRYAPNSRKLALICNFKPIKRQSKYLTGNSSADEIANVNFYDDIVHVLQPTIKFTSFMESTHVHSCQMRLLQL